MIKKLIVLALLFMATICLQIIYSGCCPDSNKCFTLNDLVLTALNNSATKPELPTNDTIPSKALLLRLTVLNKTEVCSNQPTLFISSAYAFSCRPLIKVRDSITRLSVISDHEYNHQYTAGSELNDLFVIPSTAELNTQEDSSSFDMLAKTSAESIGPHIFTIQVFYKSGTSKVVSTQPLNLIQ